MHQYFRMELLHCEKLRKQKEELEKADIDLVSAEKTNKKTTKLWQMEMQQVNQNMYNTLQKYLNFSGFFFHLIATFC